MISTLLQIFGPVTYGSACGAEQLTERSILLEQVQKADSELPTRFPRAGSLFFLTVAKDLSSRLSLSPTNPEHQSLQYTPSKPFLIRYQPSLLLSLPDKLHHPHHSPRQLAHPHALSPPRQPRQHAQHNQRHS